MVLLNDTNGVRVYFECVNHACCHRGGGIWYTYSCSKDTVYTDREDDYVYGKVSAVLPMIAYFYDVVTYARLGTNKEDGMMGYR